MKSITTIKNQVNAIDWSFAESKTQELTHGIHRYSGKFIPALARKAIELFTDPGDTVIDPFMGSGTTLLESLLFKRHSIGFDLNPLACLIAKVKTTRIDGAAVRASAARVRSRVACYCSDPEMLVFERINHNGFNAEKYRDEWFQKWFHSERLEELIFLRRIIEEETNEHCRDLLLVAFSDILRAASNAHAGYPNVMFDRKRQKPAPAIPRFLKRLNEVVEDVLSLEKVIPKGMRCTITCGDASCFPIAAESADAVITHPPYIGSIPYAEYGVVSLKWLGQDPKELDRILLGGGRQKRDVKERFLDGYQRFFAASYSALKPGRFLFILVGNPLVRGQRVDLSEMSKDCATTVGFSVTAETIRKAINRRANLMGDETVLVFRKPQERAKLKGSLEGGRRESIASKTDSKIIPSATVR